MRDTSYLRSQNPNKIESDSRFEPQNLHTSDLLTHQIADRAFHKLYLYIRAKITQNFPKTSNLLPKYRSGETKNAFKIVLLVHSLTCMEGKTSCPLFQQLL